MSWLDEIGASGAHDIADDQTGSSFVDEVETVSDHLLPWIESGMVDRIMVWRPSAHKYVQIWPRYRGRKVVL